METTEVATVFAPWLDLLPDDIDPAYKAAVQAEARATARHDQIGKIVADLEAKVAAGAADPAVDPASLMTPAAKLAAARTLASVAPPVVPVPQAKHDFVASTLPRPNPARYRMPSPPRFVGELTHYIRIHAREGVLPPVATPTDLQAIKEYQRVAAMASEAWASLGFLDGYAQGVPMGSFVAAWSETVNSPRWDELMAAITDLTALVAKADASRPEAGGCNYGPHSSLKMQPAQPTETWRYETQIRDGVLLVNA